MGYIKGWLGFKWQSPFYFYLFAAKKVPVNNETSKKEPKPKADKKEEEAEKPKVEDKPTVETKTEAKKESKDEVKEEVKKQEVIPTGDCAVCEKLAKCLCSGCKHVFYCSRECQKKHWSSHKEECKTLAKLPYRVRKNMVYYISKQS